MVFRRRSRQQAVPEPPPEPVPRPAAPKPPAPAPRKAFAFITSMGYGSENGLAQFRGSVTAVYLVMGSQSLLDLFEMPTVEVALSYSDTRQSIHRKVQQAIREQVGDSTVICLVV